LAVIRCDVLFASLNSSGMRPCNSSPSVTVIYNVETLIGVCPIRNQHFTRHNRVNRCILQYNGHPIRQLCPDGTKFGMLFSLLRCPRQKIVLGAIKLVRSSPRIERQMFAEVHIPSRRWQVIERKISSILVVCRTILFNRADHDVVAYDNH